MDIDNIKQLITEHIIPKLEDFIKSESAFFMVAFYDEDQEKTVEVMVTPTPDLEDVPEAFKMVAGEIYKNTNMLPTIVIGVEKLRYSRIESMDEVEDIDVDLMDSGVVIVAIEAQPATGIAFLYSLPDFEEVSSKEIKQDDTDPRYTLLAVATFIRETLVIAGLIEEEEEDDDPRLDIFFSKN